MKNFTTLLLKDLHVARGCIAVTILMIAALLLCPQRGAVGRNPLGWPDVASWLSLACSMVLIFTQRALLMADPPQGDRRFIATRPVRGETVFASKVAVMLLTGVFPVSLAMAVRLWTAGLGVTVAEGLMVALENAWALMSVLGLLLLWQAVPGRAWWVAVPIVLLGLLVLVVMRYNMTAEPFRTPWDPWLALLITSGFACWAALLGRYGRWRLWPSLLVTGMVWLGAAWLTDRWRCHEVPADPPSPEIKGLSFKQEDVYHTWLWWGHGYVSLNLSARVIGLPPGTWAEPTVCEGAFQGHEHGKVQHFRSDMRRVVKPGLPMEPTIYAIPGVAQSSLKTNEPSFNAQLGIVKLPTIRLPAGHGGFAQTWHPSAAKIHGVWHVDIYRAELVTTLPLRQGAQWSGSHARFEIKEIILGPAKVTSGLVPAGLKILSDSFRTADFSMGGEPSYKAALESGYGCFAIDREDRLLQSSQRYIDSSTSTVLQRRSHRYDNADIGQRWTGWLGPEGVPQRTSTEEAGDPSVVPLERIELAVFRRVKIGSAEIPFEFTNKALEMKMNP